jgi:hypothetical protein
MASSIHASVAELSGGIIDSVLVHLEKKYVQNLSWKPRVEGTS